MKTEAEIRNRIASLKGPQFQYPSVHVDEKTVKQFAAWYWAAALEWVLEQESSKNAPTGP